MHFDIFIYVINALEPFRFIKRIYFSYDHLHRKIPAIRVSRQNKNANCNVYGTERVYG